MKIKRRIKKLKHDIPSSTAIRNIIVVIAAAIAATTATDDDHDDDDVDDATVLQFTHVTL